MTAACRNKGVGSSLLSAAEAYAKELGLFRLALHVEKTNPAAIHFYKKSGYIVYRDDEHRYLMCKELSTKQGND